MRLLLHPLLALTLALTVPACAQKANTKKAEKAAAEAKTATPVLTFERTSCFGRCPAYKAQVFADGRVAYSGYRDVPVTGDKEFRLSAAAVAEMQRQAKEIHFDQLKDKYSHYTTDLPSTIVAVQQPNGQLKTVVVEEEAPDELMGYINYLRGQFDPLVGLASDR
ncbi:DUF6438 domain-containing protein [Hymenobacter sp. ASUV-10]|uniref:DUF6438 domain-containing protein n=1 Tax=Hymenobacter aranciens TaxID=3063996 RepID=A0ABT9BFD8_9BACT|nr:DUF6438 domain-containing protein [Hymenobacter sp. ASUV-10]MDO7876989.1 DUF6438 domain-containing protein [Hymenobacter sp. ASUV-10]